MDLLWLHSFAAGCHIVCAIVFQVQFRAPRAVVMRALLGSAAAIGQPAVDWHTRAVLRAEKARRVREKERGERVHFASRS